MSACTSCQTNQAKSQRLEDIIGIVIDRSTNRSAGHSTAWWRDDIAEDVLISDVARVYLTYDTNITADRRKRH